MPESADGAEIIDLYDYMPRPKPRASRVRKRKWRPVITDDLPDDLPITEADLDRYELYFADFLDEIFGKKSPN
jgi:hypothetical protein